MLIVCCRNSSPCAPPNTTSSAKAVSSPHHLTPLGVLLLIWSAVNPTKLLANPMILVAIVSFVAIVGLPKLVEKMDPELKAEFAESQRKAGSVQSNPLGSIDVAGFLAGKSSPEPPAAPAQSGKGKGKRN